MQAYAEPKNKSCRKIILERPEKLLGLLLDLFQNLLDIFKSRQKLEPINN